ncbi:hypothetical protein LX36DRAFT_653634 [Colletotrichum falcatum]|nr:hypothetical protein LX36DRAFT_653634 [Colletotrichum falcatum]
MRYQSIAATCQALFMLQAVATPLSIRQITPQPVVSCPTKELSNTTWIEEDVDGFLALASQNYKQYPDNNIQALGTYLGAPNFFCGVNEFCNAGQPCLPATLPGWYALMGIQQWNTYVNNLNLALTYTVAILGMKLPKLVNELWPKPKDNVTPVKMAFAWFNGLTNAFPITATFGAVAGSAAAAVQGNNIIFGGMMQTPQSDYSYVKWSTIADQLGTTLDKYKGAVSAYAQNVINAPINDTKYGINSVVHGGKYLLRNKNFTQDDIENWMYRTVSINAMGMILQAQNIYILRTYNLSDCDPGKYYESAFYCQQQPNNLWTRYRLTKMGSLDAVPEWRVASTLMNTYNLTKEDIYLGPTSCFDTHNHENLYNPWETASDGYLLDPLAPCNFNLNVCTIDAADADLYGPTAYTETENKSDWWCELQGMQWA